MLLVHYIYSIKVYCNQKHTPTHDTLQQVKLIIEM